MKSDTPWIPDGLWPNMVTGGFTNHEDWMKEQVRLASNGDEAAKRRLETQSCIEQHNLYMETRRRMIGP